MKKFLLILILLFSIHFWGFYKIPTIVYNFTNAIGLLILGISFIRTLQKDGLQFKNAIILFLIGIFINIISAYVNQGQAPLETFLCFGTTYFFILFYFFLHDIQPSRKSLEDIIIIFAILYSLFYIIQVAAYPDIIFNSEMYEDRETVRLRIEGNGFLMLAYFLLLNRYFLNRRFINILLALGFLIILLFGGFRTLTLVAIFLTLLMFIRLVNYSIRNYAAPILFLLLVVGLFQFPRTSKILDEMVLSSIDQKDEGKDYIRYRELLYYFNEYPQNKSYFILGGGLPGSKGEYARKMEIVQYEDGLYWCDLGLIGFYIVIGGITLLGILWFTIKAAFIKVPTRNLYISIYFGYLLIVSFTTMEIYRPGIFAVEAIGLYLIDKGMINNKNKIAIL